MKNFLAMTAYIILMSYITMEVAYQLKQDHVSDTVVTPVELSGESLYTPASISADSKSVHCLAENIFHEARNQSVEGMYAVAYVTINRKNAVKYPDTICEVVYQPYQFSWTHQNKSVDLDNKIERKAWEIAVEVAVDALNSDVPATMHGVMYYHANYVQPVWTAQKTQRVTIQDHIFYASAQ